MAVKSSVASIHKLIQKFVERQKGTWEHADWEMFLGNAAELGLDLTKEARAHLGNMLEGAKHFFEAKESAQKKTKAPKKSKVPKVKTKKPATKKKTV